MERMDTTDIKALLSAFIDDELDHERRHAVERTLATCAESRTLVDKAEQLNDLIVRDATNLAGESATDGLPAGFEQAVLLRTTRQQPIPYAHQWTTWAGWVAAAACLLLALTLYVTSPHAWNQNNTLANNEENPAPSGSTGADGRDASSLNNVHAAGLEMRSWTLDDMQSAGAFAASRNGASLVSSPAVRFDGLPPYDYAHPAIRLNDEDASALHAAAILLEDFVVFDDLNVADASRMGEVIAFDQLLGRLADVRAKVDAESGSMLLAVESVFLRLSRGVIEDDALLAEIRDDVRRLNLDGRVRDLRDDVTDEYGVPVGSM